MKLSEGTYRGIWKFAVLPTVALGMSIVPLNAQQEWLNTQHSFNLYDVNAGAVGDGQQNAIAIRARKQWTGIAGSPESFHSSYQRPFNDQKLTWGAQLFAERIGAHRSSSLEATLAYRLKLSKEQSLTFALEAGLMNYSFDVNRIESRDAMDQSLNRFQTNNWSPVFNSAVFWRATQSYAGFELTRLTRSRLAGDSDSRQSIHLKAILGHVFKLKEGMALRPSLLVRSSGGLYQFEVQSAVLIQSALWLGLGYRSEFGMIGYLEYQFSSRLRLGYSYDLPTGGPFASASSHELFLSFQWATKAGGVPSIRYF